MTLVSIVIPTRNRATLLPYAIESALAQEFDDFEVLVSDNSSSDGTPEAVRQFDDRRLRYVRADDVLHMPDSWEFAMSHARGEYVTYLSDDDAIHPQLLERAWGLMREERSKVVAYPFGGLYYHEDNDDKERVNQFVFTYPTGQMSTVSSESILNTIARSEFTHHLPRMLNCLCSMALISEARKRLGRLFFPIAPDYTAGLAILSVCSEITFLDDLLLIWGISKKSIGADQTNKRSSASETFLEEFKSERDTLYKYTPVKAKTVHNIVANSVLRMKDEIGMTGFELEPAMYFVRIYKDLIMLEENRSDVAEELRQFFEALEEQPDEIRQKVKTEIAKLNLRKPHGRFPLGVRRLIGSGKVKEVAKMMLRRPVISEFTVKGEEHGFSNITECARQINCILSSV